MSLIDDGKSIIVANGFSILKIDKKISDLKKYLSKTDTSKLIYEFDDVLDGSTGWTLNLKKAHLQNYFGLKIKSIEVYFDREDDDEGNTINKKIKSFVIFTETPATDSLEEDFCERLKTEYGDPAIRTSNSKVDELIYYEWCGETTDALVIFGTDALNKNKVDYYTAEFRNRKGP